QGNFALVLGGFLVLGLLLAFTPCMLPMIPILSGIIAGEGSRLTKSRALALSLIYVVSMALTYAVAGIAAAYAGSLIAAYLQNVWVLGAFAYRRCGPRRRRALRSRHRHGAAAHRRRRLRGRTAAEGRAVDGDGAQALRRAAARRGVVDCEPGDVRFGGNARMGGAGRGHRR